MEKMLIRPFTADDREPLVQLSLRAWAPVFQSFEQVLGTTIFLRQYPDWRRQQRETVERTCAEDGPFTVWVAEVDGVTAGFIAYTMHHEEQIGEVELLAVHPEYQNQGVGTDLNRFALDKLKAGGMRLAAVGTGGDPGHAPARRSYEKAGYVGLPLVRYYKDL